MALLCLTRAVLLDPEAAEPRQGSLLVEDGKITALLRPGDAPPEDSEVVDLSGGQIAPGFLDIHVHGATVFASPTRLPRAITDDARGMVRHGVTAFLPTSVSLPPEPLAAFVTGLAAALEAVPAELATPLGIHLEGPWLNPAAAGAQPRAGIRPFDPAEGAEILSRSAGALRMVTLAPEVGGAGALMDALARADVVSALGHSLADAQEIDAAIRRGMTHVTHLFNAMGPIHHRQPGVPGLVLSEDRLTCDLICDGVHVHPRMLQLAARAKAGRLALISDRIDPPPEASAESDPTGFGAGELRDQDGAWRLSDGRLAGSTLHLDRALRTAQSCGAMSLLEAVAACSLVPARVLGLEREYGTLRPGARADLAVLDADGGLRETWIGGRSVYRAPEG